MVWVDYKGFLNPSFSHNVEMWTWSEAVETQSNSFLTESTGTSRLPPPTPVLPHAKNSLL